MGRHTAIVLVSSLLFIANSHGSSLTGQYRTLFDYPADALGINDLEGQEADLVPIVQKPNGDVSQFISNDHLENLRRNIPGEPDVDYPIFRTPPQTDFSCFGRSIGYYADVGARCQVFRVCTNTDLTERGFAFLCPNGTLFNQEVFVCDWYQHVDCSASENFYAKNAEMHMNFNSMKDMMAVVNEMMEFPLRKNSSELPNFTKFPTSSSLPSFPTVTNQQRTTKPPFIVTTPFPFGSTRNKFTNSNQFTPRPATATATSSLPSTSPDFFEQLDVRIKNDGQTTPKQQPSGPGFGERTVVHEGDFEKNTKTENDQTNTNLKTIFSNQPLFISNVGELSTDPGSKFDINTAKIIKPAENRLITPPTAPTNERAKDQLMQSLAESFRNRQNGDSGTNADTNLLHGIQQVLQQNPYVESGEADLIEFIQRILQQNPDITADQLNAILSSESDAILGILKKSTQKTTPGGQIKRPGDNLLDSIQTILNKYKSKPIAVVNGIANERVPVLSGEGDLLKTLQRIVQQSQIPIFSGEADLLQFIERLIQQNPDFSKEQLNTILSGEADSILRFLNQQKQRNNGFAISIGEADLLEAIQLVLQKYLNNGITSNSQTINSSNQQSTPAKTGSLIQNQKGVLNINRPFVQSVSQQPSGARDSTNQGFFNPNTNNKNDIKINTSTTKPVSTIAFNQQAIDSLPQPTIGPFSSGKTQFPKSGTFLNQNPNNEFEAVYSGEADLLQTLQQILLRIPNQRQPIFSGEADLLQFIERLKQQYPDLTVNQLNAIIAGEANSILRNLNEKAKKKQAILSGEADLLEAIQNILEKYRRNNQALVPPLPDPVFSGEADLLQTLQRILQQITEPIFSGEADLLQFIRQIENRNTDLTPNQINAVLSGELDSILRIFNQRRQQSVGTVISGEADLLDSIQIVIENSRSNTSTRISAVESGESDLLQTLQRVLQRTQIPIFSGEADLIQFIERIQQLNPDFTKDQLNAIISGEADSLLQILNGKAQKNQSNGIAVLSGEANLLEAIQIILQKYRSTSTTATQTTRTTIPLQSVPVTIAIPTSVPAPTPVSAPVPAPVPAPAPAPVLAPVSVAVQSGESDLLETLRQIKQQTSVPLFSGEADLLQFYQRLQQQNPNLTPSQLNDIISRNLDAILQYLQFLRDTAGRQQFSDFAVYSGEEDLLVAVQFYVEHWLKPETIATTQTTESTPTSQSVPIYSGESDLLQALQRIRQQSTIPIFSGEADLVQFIEEIKQRNPDFTTDQLTAIISGEADSILQILNGRIQRNQTNGILVSSGEVDLLEAIQLVLQKYRSKSIPSPTLPQTIPSQSFLTTRPQSTFQPILTTPAVTPATLVPVQSGESDLLQTIERIRQQSLIPIYSGEANLVQFIELIKQRNPDLTANQLNAIISGEADSILQILNERRQKGSNIAIISGEADLLEAIQQVIQKYKTNTATQAPGVSLSPVYSGESDLVQSLRNIQQQVTVPVFSGEADLVQFIELVKKSNPDFTPEQLGSIISGEANSISQILNDKTRSSGATSETGSSTTTGVQSGEADLLNAIFQVLKKYRRHYHSAPIHSQYGPPTSVQPIDYQNVPLTHTQVSQPHEGIQNANNSTVSLRGQLTAFNAGQQNSFYHFSNQDPHHANAGIAPKATYSVEQNKQSQFSNQHSQSTQSQITKNVFREQDNIYTKTAISHQTRSQSTSTNSEKFHYKITQTIPFTQTISVPVQNIQSSVTSPKLPSTYIPPYPTRSSYSYTPTPPSKQVFTYPAVLINALEVSNSTLNRNTDPTQTQHYKDKSRQRNAFSSDISKDRRSADLFLKGLHLSYFESNDLNPPDYRTIQSPKLRPRKRMSYFNSNFYDATQNYHKLLVDFSKLAIHNETKDIYNSYTDADRPPTRIISRFSFSSHNTPRDIKLTTTTPIPIYLTTLKASTPAAPRDNLNKRSENTTAEPFLIQETQAHRQRPSVSIARDSNVSYQTFNKQFGAQQLAAAPKAYVYTEIENRKPSVNPEIPRPPLQNVYPKSIQNNAIPQVVSRVSPIRQYQPIPIPSSLPSIVHEPSNTVATIQNVPATYSGYAPSYPLPVISSTYSNRQIYSQANSNAREKVIVKVVKAPGWYLNDANERRSYYDAVAHGLLSDNGLVYVNNVQRENTQFIQNGPANLANAVPSSFTQTQTQTSRLQRPSLNYSPRAGTAPQLPSGHSYGTSQPFSGINYCPCAKNAYTQLPQPQIQTQSQRLSLKKRSTVEGVEATNRKQDPYDTGHSSYNVDSKSVGRLAGDNDRYQYNLSSLRQYSAAQPIRPTQKTTTSTPTTKAATTSHPKAFK